MSLPIRFLRAASMDLEQAYAWYESKRAGLGDGFLDALQGTLEAIADNPERHPPIEHPYRRAMVRRFPFGVVFRVDGEQVHVVAVWHGSRNPEELSRPLDH